MFGTIVADHYGAMQEGMLARFAMALQRGQIEGVGGQGFGGQGGTIVVDDNFNLILPFLAKNLNLPAGSAHGIKGVQQEIEEDLRESIRADGHGR